MQHKADLRFSVIVPVYRAEKYLPVCVESILAQDTTASYEIILVDDGSPDRCGDLCDAYAAQYSCIRVLHKPNGGVSSARNEGIRLAQGEYVLFADSDDWWEEDLLTSVEVLLRQSPDMAAFTFYENSQHGERANSLPLVPAGESGKAWLASVLKAGTHPHISTWAYLFRRAFLLEDNLLFREDLPISEDFYMLMRAIPLAKSVVGINRPLYHYRANTESLSHTPSPEKIVADITVKAELFREMPVAAMADIFAGAALGIARLPKSAAAESVAVVEQNRDILGRVSQSAYIRFLPRIMKTLGIYNGIRMYCILQKLKICLFKG